MTIWPADLNVLMWVASLDLSGAVISPASWLVAIVAAIVAASDETVVATKNGDTRLVSH